jgi:putative transposase
MSRKRFTPEQIILKLREAEVALAPGQTAAQVCGSLGTSDQLLFKWRPHHQGAAYTGSRLW